MQLAQFRLHMGETRLLVKSDLDGGMDHVRRAISSARADLVSHIRRYPEFRWSIEPLLPPEERLPGFISEMYDAGTLAEVGPFASVAGALAKIAAESLVEGGASSVVVENGGDLCLYGEGPFIVGLFAGDSVFSGRLAFRVAPGKAYAGLCTSSGKVGESMSLGEADAVTAYAADSPALADAVATSVCSVVRGADGVDSGLARARGIGKAGVLILDGERMGAWGVLPEIVELAGSRPDMVVDPRVHSRA